MQLHSDTLLCTCVADGIGIMLWIMLLEASRQAVEAAPESAGAWQMRATVLGCFEE